jgi:hypothetical protein
VSEHASESTAQRLREAPAERSEAVRVSERASESTAQRLREAPAERSEAVR